jgi:hypothetical protein
MTYERAFERAKERTAVGIPSLPGRNRQKPGGYIVYRVPLSSAFPRYSYVSRGAAWAELHPVEGRPFGERNGAHIHPERVLRGEQVGHAKLKELDVIDIRDAYKRGLFTRSELAKLFTVTSANIGYILKRKTWRHVA